MTVNINQYDFVGRFFSYLQTKASDKRDHGKQGGPRKQHTT